LARVSASCRHVASAQCRIIWRRRRRPALVQRASSNPFRSWFRQTELLGRNQAASCNVPCRPATKFCQPSFLWALAAGRALSHFNVGHHRGRAPGHTEMLRDHPPDWTPDGRWALPLALSSYPKASSYRMCHHHLNLSPCRISHPGHVSLCYWRSAGTTVGQPHRTAWRGTAVNPAPTK